jgi:dolichyl-phosphate beta-glucosyltransferase
VLHNEPTVHLSVVIPAFNEVARIAPTIRDVVAYLDAQPFDSEVLVVSDGSDDGTDEEVTRAAAHRAYVSVLNNGVNRGKGFSVLRGVLESRGRFILFSDADGSMPIAQVERLLTALAGGHDVAIGSRAVPGAHVRGGVTWWRRAMGRGFNALVQQLALPGIQDSQCGFKCFTRDVARQVFPRQRLERFGFDVEILWVARKLGYSIAEVPITCIDRPGSKIRVLRDSLGMVMDLFRVRLHDAAGHYGKRSAERQPDRAAVEIG